MYKIYQVLANESLDDIANKFNTTKEELLKLNGKISNLVGSYLIVPNNNGKYQTYIVKEGDNIYKIADEHNIEYETLLKINGLDPDDYIYPNQQILLPLRKMYITSDGDTIGFILKKLDITADQIGNLDELKLKSDQTIIVK